mmetsp:Transcript_108896/g.302803  ORF Transcript_108896/g.302803 Transcript_108896/m.302803 type:complete len:309 (+) Transcript_108896:78-1004(+)
MPMHQLQRAAVRNSSPPQAMTPGPRLARVRRRRAALHDRSALLGGIHALAAAANGPQAAGPVRHAVALLIGPAPHALAQDGRPAADVADRGAPPALRLPALLPQPPDVVHAGGHGRELVHPARQLTDAQLLAEGLREVLAVAPEHVVVVPHPLAPHALHPCQDLGLGELGGAHVFRLPVPMALVAPRVPLEDAGALVAAAEAVLDAVDLDGDVVDPGTQRPHDRVRKAHPLEVPQVVDVQDDLPGGMVLILLQLPLRVAARGLVHRPALLREGLRQTSSHAPRRSAGLRWQRAMGQHLPGRRCNRHRM